MRPVPVAAGFQRCRPGSVSRAAKSGCSAIANGEKLSAMPLIVADFTNSRREMCMLPHFSLAAPALPRCAFAGLAQTGA